MHRRARNRYRRLDIAVAVRQHRQDGELWLAQCQVLVGHLGDALRTDHTCSCWIGSHDRYDEGTLMAGARGDAIERPGELLARVGLELDLEDATEHGLVLAVDVVDEEHDRVGVVLDRYELIERSFGEHGLGETRNLNVQQVAERLTLSGIEVEKVWSIGVYDPLVVVGEVVSVEALAGGAGAKRVQVLVDRQRQLISSLPDLERGRKFAVALPGATLFAQATIATESSSVSSDKRRPTRATKSSRRSPGAYATTTELVA